DLWSRRKHQRTGKRTTLEPHEPEPELQRHAEDRRCERALCRRSRQRPALRRLQQANLRDHRADPGYLLLLRKRIAALSLALGLLTCAWIAPGAWADDPQEGNGPRAQLTAAFRP